MGLYNRALATGKGPWQQEKGLGNRKSPFQEPIDWRYPPQKKRPIFQGISPQNMANNTVLTTNVYTSMYWILTLRSIAGNLI